MPSLAEMPAPSTFNKLVGSKPSPPIRVGFVMHSMQVAGAEVLVKQIIEQLPAEIEPTVFCLDSLGELGEELLAAGVPVVVLDRQPGLDWKLSARLAKEVRLRRIQVLHAHQYTPFFYSALARLRGAWPTRIVLTEHGRHYPDIVSWKRRFANRWLLSKLADLTTACCDFSAKALEVNDGFSKVMTLPNGVDLKKLPPRGDATEQAALRQSLQLEVDRPYVACVARFHPIKDHAMLVRAWALVQQKIPRARLLLVGDGPERKRIAQQVEQLGISDSVKFLGIRHDVASLLHAVDVFTLTSISEAASLTLLEAMASECPPVVTEVGGSGEHVADGVEGRLVPRGDSACLAERLVELLRDPEKAVQLGQAARQRVIAAFNLDDAVQRYYQLYQQVIDH